MKKSSWKIYLGLVVLLMAFSGCAPALTPGSSTFTPSPIPPTFTPKPTSTVMPSPSMTPTSSAGDTPTTPSGSSEVSSVANITTIEFIGKKFESKFKAVDQPIQIYEYYLSNETPSDWFELVEIQIYPENPDGNKPIDFARRTAAAFIQQYPDMQYALLTDNNSDAVLLDFFYPTSTREGFLEFDAFKYFKDPDSSHVICFHYAKNIEGASSSRSIDDVLGEIIKTRQEIESAMAEFNLFSR